MIRGKLNIYVYGDESGVFDKRHNDFFVFGGLIFLDKESKEAEVRKFLHAERAIAPFYGCDKSDGELKACRLKKQAQGQSVQIDERVH